MNHNKQIFVALLFYFTITSMLSAQVILDMESGNKQLDEFNDWGVQHLEYASGVALRINGNYSGKTEPLVAENISKNTLVSPWFKFTKGDKISFKHKLDTKNIPDLKSYVVYSIKYGEEVAVFDTLINQIYIYGVEDNVILVDFVVPENYDNEIRKVIISFIGFTGSEKAIIDDIKINAEYYSDPTNNYKPISEKKDADGDGIADDADAYPNDKFRSYKFTFPEKGFGTLLFEDLWPNIGDYDFNDLVIDYSVSITADAEDNLVDIELILALRAWGSSFSNGFAIQLNGISPDKILEVTGYKNYNNSPFKLNNNGTEADIKDANIVLISDVTKALLYSGGTGGVNTNPLSPKVTPDTTIVKIKFMEDGIAASGGKVNLKDFYGLDFLNPYIIVNQQRGHEIHMPNSVPTEKVDKSLFGKGADNSNFNSNNYYITKNNLPWVLAIDAGSIPYATEKTDFTKAFPKFIDWAESNGELFNDWYEDKLGYRNLENIFK